MPRLLPYLILVALMQAAPAFAQDPVKDAYGGAGNVASEVESGAGVDAAGSATAGPARSAAAVQPLRGTELPFTGLDLGLVVGGGTLLLALGLGVRRVSREPAT